MSSFIYWPLPGIIVLLTNSACLGCTLGGTSGFKKNPPTLSSGVPTFLTFCATTRNWNYLESYNVVFDFLDSVGLTCS